MRILPTLCVLLALPFSSPTARAQTVADTAVAAANTGPQRQGSTLAARGLMLQERSEAVSLAGPVILTATGVLMAAGFGVATTIEWLMTTDLTNNPREPNRARLIGLGMGALGGVAVAASGLVWTIRRGRARRESERAALLRREQKGALELVLQPSVSTSYAGAAVSGRF